MTPDDHVEYPRYLYDHKTGSITPLPLFRDMPQQAVEKFHRSMGQAVNAEWTFDLISLRRNLIKEEYKEVMDAMDDVLYEHGSPEAKAAFLKELADLVYVLYGTAVSLGLDLQEAFNRVHASNMSKLGPDGKPVFRHDGKVLKGPNYKPPDLKDLI